LADDVDLGIIARGTPGFAGAELANLVNEAALLAARQNRKVVTMQDFEEAKDKVRMGTERRSRIVSAQEQRRTAYHEAGHAILASLLPDAMPLHKVTIVPRGQALGLTYTQPDKEDRLDMTKDEIQATIAMMMGGRVADEKFLKIKTVGAKSDIERATDLARRMVCEFGMSDLGPLSFGKKEEQIFLGREIAQHRDFSEATAIRIDEEVKKIVEKGYETAQRIMDERSDAVVRIAEALIEREVLDAAEVKVLIEGGTLPPMRVPARTPRPSGDDTKVQPAPGGLGLPGPQPA
jgi:cell division protease FtsH